MGKNKYSSFTFKYVETYLWEKTSTPPSLSNKSRKTVEYILCYEKNKNTNKYFGEMLENGDVPLLNTGNMPKELIFPKGTIQFKIDDGIYSKGLYEKVELLNDVEVCEGVNKEEARLKGSFKWTQEKLDEEMSKGTYFLVKTDKFSIRFQREDNGNFKTPNNFLGEIKFDKKNKIGTNETASKELEELKMGSFFDYPKPQSLIKSIVNFITYQDKESIILDFFSGSATTAHAVMQLNAEDGGNRKYIMVQLPEPCDEKSEAYKAGYKNICEIGKERIRRAGAKIKADETLPLENREKLDVDFKVFKLDSSNIKEWDSETEDLRQSLFDSVDNIKSDRTSLDVLYEIILKYGLELTVPIEERENFYSIGGGTLLINLDKEIDMEIIDSICEEYKNLLEIDEEFKTTVILRDSAFKNDIDKTNAMKKLEQVGIREVRSI